MLLIVHGQLPARLLALVLKASVNFFGIVANPWSSKLDFIKYQFFEQLPIDKTAESFDTVLERPNLKIERIVSNGHCSAKDFWYEQEKDEWVLLLSGAAVLAFSSAQGDRNERVSINLMPGEAVYIPAGQRHRVVCTDPDKPTVWLAIHFDSGSPAR